MTHWYWEQIGGTLIEEFHLTTPTTTTELRRLDGLILPNGEQRIADWRENLDIAHQHVISVQTKNSTLGMELLGQTLFSQQLLYRNFHPAHVDAVALCRNTDDALEEIANTFPDLTIVTVPTHINAE